MVHNSILLFGSIFFNDSAKFAKRQCFKSDTNAPFEDEIDGRSSIINSVEISYPVVADYVKLQRPLHASYCYLALHGPYFCKSSVSWQEMLSFFGSLWMSGTLKDKV